jgi:hypothetical protein
MKSNAKVTSNGFFNLRGTLNVKFGIYMRQSTIWGGGGRGGGIR